MSAKIRVAGLTKSYGGRLVLDGISFEVGAGTVFGLLGPNGAGKTTLLECVAGLRQPDGGSIAIAGVDALAAPERARARLGVALQATALQDRLTPREAFRLFGAFYPAGVPAEALLARFSLTEKADAAYDSLSDGQKQRLALALAFVNDPEILVLDEPAAGLDPLARRELHQAILQLRAEGRTVLLTTHDLDEACLLCDQLAILREGCVVASGGPAELIARGSVSLAPSGQSSAASALEDVFIELTASARAVPGSLVTAPVPPARPRAHWSGRPVIAGLIQHLLLTLRLNFRSRGPVIYGYIVPIFFLLSFASIFGSSRSPLLHEMGQLLTITILGGTCFGLPTALVAERDRGIWRRYRLLPAPAAAIILSASVARALLVGSAAVLQLVLAWALYGTPWPAHPGQLVLAFGCVCWAFLGLGLIIAMLADNVPSVQAIGQCVFLPMIIIGGVGVPLRSLPAWAQRIADFLPGRYAVEALDACLAPAAGGLAGALFALLALGVIGVAAFLATYGLFRWDGGPRRLDRAAKGWIALALSAWLVVGLAAGRWRVHAAALAPALDQAVGANWQTITAADIAAIRYDDLPPDAGYYVPVATSLEGLPEDAKARLDSIADVLTSWPPGQNGSLDQRTRNLLSVCAVADLARDENEGEIALLVFEQIRDTIPAPALLRVLAWIILHPGDGRVQTEVPEFGIQPVPDERAVRERCAAYAKKLLWRLRH